MRMDEGSKGGGSVVKNRNSSGCLVVKKKRPHLTSSGSSEGDELVGFDVRRGGGPGATQGSCVPVVYKRGVGNHGEFSSRINDFDDVGFGRSDLMREVGFKRSELDVYDFDEYDDFSDVEGLGMRHFYERDNVKMLSNSGQGIEFDSGGFGKGDIIYKRRDSFRGSTTSEMINRGGDRRSRKQRFEVKPENPRSTGKEKVGGSRDAAIRLQGRNGVLKVMVKNKEIKGKLKPRNKGNSVVSRSQEITPKNVSIHHSSYSERRLQKRPMGIGGVDEDRLKRRKTFSVKSSEDSDQESEDSDTSLKLQSESMEAHLSMKRGRDEGTIRSRQIAQQTKSKEMKVKRGSGTEKQLLREKIRNMLLDASWTIDYRPRRGRDYSDAVYINPSGTAYWSIIKAYEALQKQLEEDGKRLKAAEESPSFDPISDDVLRKLTRQTKKKMEKELQRKKREESKGKLNKEFSVGNFEEDDDSDTDSTGSGRHDDRLSSFMKRSGKSFKGTSKEAYPNLNGKMSERDERSSSMFNSGFIHGRKSKKIGRCTLLIRNPQKGMDSESDKYVPYTGKRNLLSWLIDSGTVKLSEKVHYMNRRRTRMMLEGWITRDGIHCSCCSKILTVSKFEIHAASKLRQPFQNIYSSSGLSLLQCQVEAWNRQDESFCSGFHKIDVNGDDPNDDTCAICGDGGNLICCDGCPSTFHLNCLDIQMLPAGDWHCPHCSCKFCGLAELSGTEANDKTKDTVLTCSLCERKYHSACAEEMDDTPVNANSSVSFCGKKCQEVFERLQKLLGVKCELDGGLFWSLIQRTTLGTDTSVRGYPQRVEWNSKLAVALSVMDECFLPITDRRSGIHTIHNVLYNCGSNFTRLNYNGFYTAILEKGDEIICAASIRIRGTQFAEMPFIGTRHIYRRQGMCRRLFSAIELALRSLKVEKLIIPAISELMETWTTVFGFCALGDSDKREMKTFNTLAFPGTDMLQKQLLHGQISAKKNLAGMNALEDCQHTSRVFDLIDKPDPDAGPSSASAWSDDNNMKEKSIADMCVQDHTYPDITSGRVFNEANKIGPLALNECVDADDNEFLHSSPDAVDEIQEIGKYLNDSPVKHDMDESENHNLPQEAENGEADVALTPTDVPVPGTSDTAPLDSFLRNDNHAHNDETICLNIESSADVEQHGLLEATHNDDITTENPNIEVLAEGNNIQHSLEDEVDSAHEVLPKVADSSSSLHVLNVSDTKYLDVTREEKVHVSESEADGVVRSLKDGSHGPVEIRDPLPDSHDQVSIEASSFQPDHNVSCENLGLEKPELDSCEISKVNPGDFDLIKHPPDTCEISTGNPEEVDLIKHPLDTCEISTVNPEEVDDLIKHPVDPCEISKVNPGEVDLIKHPLDTCEISTGNPEEVDLTKHPLDSWKISTVNPGEVNLIEHLLDSCTGNNMPISDGELPHPHDNGVEIANTPPISNSSFKASSPNDEAISHSTENPSSLSSVDHHSST